MDPTRQGAGGGGGGGGGADEVRRQRAARRRKRNCIDTIIDGSFMGMVLAVCLAMVLGSALFAYKGGGGLQGGASGRTVGWVDSESQSILCLPMPAKIKK